MHSSIVRCLLAQRAATQHRPQRWRIGLLLSSSFALIIFMMICGSPNIQTLTQGAANMLSLSIKITDQYSTTAPQVGIYITFLKGGVAEPLDGKLSIACDGVVALHHSPILESGITVPRRPAGDAYHCVYTDEKGIQAALSLPIPDGTLAVTSPRPYATVLIPHSPTPPTIATPTYGAPRPGDFINALRILYTLPALPARTQAELTARATMNLPRDARVDGKPTTQASGIYMLSDDASAYGQGFESFGSGSGEIDFFSALTWSPPRGEFQAVQLQYADTFLIHVLWSDGSAT